MSVPIQLYRTLLRSCRRFDRMPQPRSIEPLLCSPVVFSRAGIEFFLGAKSAAACVRESFRRPIADDDAVNAINEGFHCLRVMHEAEDLAKQNLVAEDGVLDFSDDDEDIDEGDSDSEEDVDKLSCQRGVPRITIFHERPHFVHEPFELQDLLRDSNSATSNCSRENSTEHQQRGSEQLTLDLISAIDKQDALTVQSITAELLDIPGLVIPRNTIPAIIESCCSTLNSSLIFRLFEKLRKDGVTIPPKFLIPLFQHAGEYDDVSATVAALRETIWASGSVSPVAVECEQNDPHDKMSLHAVMWICSNVCQHDVVESLFKQMVDRGVPPDRITELILLRSICCKRDPDIPRALELIAMFENEWKIPPCPDVFNILLFAFYNSPAYNLHDAFRLFQCMERREILPTKESYQALLLCAAKDEKERIPDTAMQLQSVLKSLDHAGFNVHDLIDDIANKLDARWRL